MATPQLSPGVLVREVDLTVGRADNVLDNIGAIAGFTWLSKEETNLFWKGVPLFKCFILV